MNDDELRAQLRGVALGQLDAHNYIEALLGGDTAAAQAATAPYDTPALLRHMTVVIVQLLMALAAVECDHIDDVLDERRQRLLDELDNPGGRGDE